MPLVTEELRAKADEVYYGDQICQEKTRLLLKEVGLPNGLLPLKDIEECGIVRETGFVWLKQKKSHTHKFDKVGRLVTYAKEVTAIVEKNKVRKLTGVKAKELLIWLTISEIYVDDPPTGKVTFQSPTGLSRTFPTSAFEVQEEEVKEVKDKEVEEKNKKREVEEKNKKREVEEKNKKREVEEKNKKREVEEKNKKREMEEKNKKREVNAAAAGAGAGAGAGAAAATAAAIEVKQA